MNKFASISLTRLAAGVLAFFLISGCKTTKVANDRNQTPQLSTWSNCYSLLHQLLGDEQDVNKLRFIKHEQPDVKNLINNISAVSAAGVKQLEAYAKQDSTIILDDTRLPRGEESTRDAISSTKTKELLGHSGEKFELALLLTQAEATDYAAHLAKVAAKNDVQPERAKYLASLSAQMIALHEDIFKLLLARMNSPEKAAAQR